jgi:hypothetical protein
MVATRAAALGEFPENPMVAFIPADTAYAFASFKPVPADFVRTITKGLGPIFRRAYDEELAKEASETKLAKDTKAAIQGTDAKEDDDGDDEDDDGGGDDGNNSEITEAARAFLSWLGELDAKKLDELGFSSKARFTVYGLGAYPVARIELSSGDRVFHFLQTALARRHIELPPHVERAGRRYWLIDEDDVGVLVSVADKELVVALAPREVLDANLGALLGDQPPAKHLTTADFRELARRDGFTGQGVGFVDVPRAAALASEAAEAQPACRTAITALARRVPRLAFGFDDFTAHRMTFGMVLELAPDVLADVRKLAIPLAGYDRVIAQRPALALAVAVDVDRARALLSRLAMGMREIGQRCDEEDSFNDVVVPMAAAAVAPIPPPLAGLRGGFAVLNDLKISTTPMVVDGFGLIQTDHAAELLAALAREVPGLQVARDGKAHALPSMLPFAGHVAASERGIGIAVGRNSPVTAVELSAAPAVPAPLAMMAFDYQRLADPILATSHGKSADETRAVIAALGLLTTLLVVDERGSVLWTSLELR